MIATGMDDNQNPRGESLRDRQSAYIQEGLPGLPISELINCLSEAAFQLDDRTNPHGNIKPDTIIVDEDSVTLVDHLDELFSSNKETTISGTPIYMGPEVWRGTRLPHSDQYALACTYAELRTGHPPFVESGILELMRAHLECKPDLTGCDDAERRVLERALAKVPDKRYPSCVRFVEELRQAVT